MLLCAVLPAAGCFAVCRVPASPSLPPVSLQVAQTSAPLVPALPPTRLQRDRRWQVCHPGLHLAVCHHSAHRQGPCLELPGSAWCRMLNPGQRRRQRRGTEQRPAATEAQQLHRRRVAGARGLGLGPLRREPRCRRQRSHRKAAHGSQQWLALFSPRRATCCHACCSVAVVPGLYGMDDSGSHDALSSSCTTSWP